MLMEHGVDKIQEILNNIINEPYKNYPYKIKATYSFQWPTTGSFAGTLSKNNEEILVFQMRVPSPLKKPQ